MHNSRALSVLLLLAQACVSLPQAKLPPYKPSATDLKAAYERADSIGRENSARVYMLQLEPHWYDNGRTLWYRKDSKGGKREFISVDAASGDKRPSFDHARLARSLSEFVGKVFEADKLPFRNIQFLDDSTVVGFEAEGQSWRCDLATYALRKLEIIPTREGRQPPPWRQDLWATDAAPRPSPDGRWTARLDDFNVVLKDSTGGESKATNSGSEAAYFARTQWSPDGKRLVATRVSKGDRKEVYLVESSPRNGGPAVLSKRVYDRPGDKVDTFDIWIVDPETKSSTKVLETVDYGNLPNIRWRKDNRHFIFDKMDRGYGRWRVIEVDVMTGQSRTLVDDDPETFVDSTAHFVHYCRESEDIIWRSERDGWAHLYYTAADGKIRNQITKGPWVVRNVVRVDEGAKEITFTASGMNPTEDPYFVHFYRIKFDGTRLVELTPAPGNHSVGFSPDRAYIVDTYSQPNVPQVHELRRASDGKLVTVLERADISELQASGWRAPEVFVAKGRDGKTDIWGLVYRPSKLDPKKSYPIVEDIYAGPQDSFVPKTFAVNRYPMAELGFVMVKLDGMGTRNRSKAFHDVCYRNLGDAGLPDRILWIKALAAKYPYMDTSRVGIYGTSAGGQSSTGALLFHPEFYKVAVSSCGCHDNRLDKIWWNEQWMGPMGPHYAEQSNITNAGKLQGKLMLMVGELDSNVPPESTYRLCDALIKAGKDFDFILLPGLDHTGGGSYGERRRRDFFVRHLHNVAPPERNAMANRNAGG